MNNVIGRLLIFIFFFGMLYSTARAQITFENKYGTAFKEVGKSVKQTPDGGYIIGGTNLVKTTDSGIVEWTKPYPSVYANTTADSGYILINNSTNIYITKVDQFGNVSWNAVYNQGNWSRAGYSIEQTNDGGYIVSGRYQSVTGSGMMLLKLNSLGVATWRKTFFEPTSAAFCYGIDVHQTADNGFIIAGYASINHYDSNRNYNVYVVKTDSLGNLEWENDFGGTGDELAYSVQQTVNGSYNLAGRKYEKTLGVTSMYLLKLDNLGNLLWTRSYGQTDSSVFKSVWETTDYSYILAGHSNVSTNGGTSDIEVWKVDSAGVTLWNKQFGGAGEENANSIQQTIDHGYIITGLSESNSAGLEDVYLLKLDSVGNISTPVAVDDWTPPLRISLYPNPTQSIFYVESDYASAQINFYSLDGQVVHLQKLIKGNSKIQLGNLSKGIYLYQVISDAQIIRSGKLDLK